MAGGQLAHQCLVQRFDEAHVDHGGIERTGHFSAADAAAEDQHGDLAAVAAHHALADLAARPGWSRSTALGPVPRG